MLGTIVYLVQVCAAALEGRPVGSPLPAVEAHVDQSAVARLRFTEHILRAWKPRTEAEA
jgi:hypothetical protein